ncbi:MAG: putative outer rane efflux protein [Phycisphaerales bacterium]|nr:putative outer rane efflux protein [Phycisphaerales bacterium]
MATNLLSGYSRGNPVRNRHFILVVAALILSGCSAEFAEREADRQVTALVKDRQDKTLGYRPQVEATTDPKNVKPTTQAYAKIPQTPHAPAAAPQAEPLRVVLEYGQLGPKRFDWASGEDIPRASFDYETLDSRIRNRLRLGPPTLEERPVRLDFFGSLSYGVQHSRTYQTTMEDLYLAALDVTLQRHLFEPRPFVGGSLEYAGGQKDVNYRAALTSTARAGVRQQLPYGGELVAQGLVSFVNALDGNAASGENASVVLSGSIPLLRGAGMVNLEPLISGERTLVYQVRTFENFRRDFVISIATQYFRLLSLQQSVLNRRVNYASFVTLTERSRALYSTGRVAYIELQRSLQEQLSAENQLITAQETYAAALDDFKLLLGMPTEQALDITAVELDVALPKTDDAQSLALAMKYRLDLQTARDRVDDTRRRVENAKNGLLPDLTLSGQTAFGNRANDPASRLDERTNTYSARVDLDLPIDRVAERNQYRAALIDVRRAQRDFEDLKDRIVSDVRESLRLIQESQATLQIQVQAVDLAQRRRENAYELLRNGKSTSTRDLVEAQNSLLQARDLYEQASATLQVNVLRFLRNSGTLRLDPDAGALGHAMDRAAEIPVSTEGAGANNLPHLR